MDEKSKLSGRRSISPEDQREETSATPPPPPRRFMWVAYCLITAWVWTTFFQQELFSRRPDGLPKIASHQELRPYTYEPLPLGAIKPRGWLRSQLRLSAAGLAGHELDFYDIVRDSPWLNGSAEYSPLNEALPYWFNGLVSLAYGLDDARLKDQVRGTTTYILRHQFHERSGWLGPEAGWDGSNLWGRFPLALGLMQLAQAEPSLREDIVDALHGFARVMHHCLHNGDWESANEVWGRARYADMLLVLQWLYEHHPRDSHELLLAAMASLQKHSANWERYFTEAHFPFADIDTMPLAESERLFKYLHAVNAAQGLKSPGVDYRLSGRAADLAAALRGANWTLAYHGSAAGAVVGDERMAGQAPNRGSELCSVAELLFSLATLHQLAGAAWLADAAERAAFNALPAMLTADHWAHQYIALANQPWARPNDHAHDGLWWNVGPEALVFGVAPNYPCCAVNFVQAWPKLLAAAFTRLAGDEGIAHSVLVPAQVETRVQGGKTVRVACDTDYPFGTSFTYTADAGAAFTLAVRLPGWHVPSPLPTALLTRPASTDAAATATTVTARGWNAHTRMLTFRLPAGRSELRLDLAPPALRAEARANGTVAVARGGVLYALDVGQRATAVAASVAGAPRRAASVYYEGTLPWNVAIDPGTLQWHGDGSEGEGQGLPDPLWAYHAPPGHVTARACRIAWPVWNGVPAPVPLPGERECQGPSFEVTLRPYGSLRARMTELPVVSLGGGGERAVAGAQ